MSPVIRECERREIDFQIIHSGQHYSFEMDRVFFDELGIPAPMHRLEVGSGTHAEQTGRIMIGVERALREVASGTVLVQGDTNTVLAGAVAARKLGCHVGHVEAGLRSFDRTMPEEINRVVADLVSDMLFAPTPQARENLTREGVSGTILVTGNTIVDAVQRNLELAETRSDVLEKLDLTPGGFMLATVHRQENADRRERLENIITGLDRLCAETSTPLLLPLHPRTKARIDEFGIEAPRLTILPPLGYFDFLRLEASARLVLTDSGGVQEEACILGVPCVTLRENTERPETIEVGSNLLAGTDPDRIIEKAGTMMARPRTWPNPFGDGMAASHILDALEERSLV